jgi:hypothetical protein
VKDAGFHEMKDNWAVPLSAREWLERDLPGVDRLLGEWITTTSRILLSADTGLGKTSFSMAIAACAAVAVPFLHWQAHRVTRVLYMDGEMSRRLLKLRIEDVVRRLGQVPTSLFFLNREDFEEFEPLNTPGGQLFLDGFIEQIGGVDLIIFDNVMALLDGDQKDEESWTRVLPLINSLTKRGIGQIWINHTGHDASRSYGSKTKEWRMDTTIHLSAIKRNDADISFSLEFRKARERTPDNRADFEDVIITLLDDEWTSSTPPAEQFKPKPGTFNAKLLEILTELLRDSKVLNAQGRRIVKIEAWRSACEDRHLLDREKPKSADSAFNRSKRDLLSANLIACQGDKDGFVWTLP